MRALAARMRRKRSIGELFQGFFQREREKKGAVRSPVDTVSDWLGARSDLIIRLTLSFEEYLFSLQTQSNVAFCLESIRSPYKDNSRVLFSLPLDSCESLVRARAH